MQANRITYLGRSCFYIQLDEQNFLVDAHLTERKFSVDPHLFLTEADAAHFDVFSYKFISCNQPIYLPPASQLMIARHLPNPLEEMDIYKSVVLGSVKVTAVPTKHSAFRLRELSNQISMGYIFEGSKKTIYVSGASGYGPHFAEIGSRFKIDVSCLPLGPAEIQFAMKGQYLQSQEVLDAASDLGTQEVIPVYEGRVPWLATETSMAHLQQLLTLNQPKAQFHFLQSGGFLSL